MRFFKTIVGIWLCLFGQIALAQQHLNKGWSLSGGMVLNAKGANVSAHYHLNPFDELRISLYQIQQAYINPSRLDTQTLKTDLLCVEYAMGFKYQNWQHIGIYIGAGTFWGTERLDRNTAEPNKIYGLDFFYETDYAPFPWSSIFGRFKMLIPFTVKRSKSLRLMVGTRVYF